MSNKYSRYTSVVSRQYDESFEDDYWLKKFERSLQKGAVQSKSVDSSLFDQINAIMNGKSKYPSVDAAVKDMQQRSGLTAYLDKISKITNDQSKKIASGSDSDYKSDSSKDEKSITVLIFEKCPHIKNTLENIIRSSKGNSVVPAIIDRLRSIHQNDISNSKYWEDENLIREVSRLNLIAKRDNPDSYSHHNNLGSHDSNPVIDPSNTDAFHSLMPAKQ